MCCLAGYLSNFYGIPINEKSVFTHYEFDQKQRKRQGKIDITHLHYLPTLSVDEVGSYFRSKATWYKQKSREGKYKFQKKGEFYEFDYID